MTRRASKGKWRGFKSGDLTGTTCATCGDSIEVRGADLRGYGKTACPTCRKSYNKSYRRDKYFQYAWDTCRRRALRKGVEFDLTPEYMEQIWQDRCPVLGMELSREGSISDNTASLDRIDSDVGYVVGNVQWMSYLANRMKSNATPEQLLRFADWIINQYR